MLLFLDTEFTGLNQAKPDLISIALVDESGREFYAELPESDWTVQCTEWVHFNVLPHLWGGSYVQSRELIRERLVAWIEVVHKEAVIITDFADSDFFKQLKPLLTTWPANLHPWPLQFSAWSMGDDREPELRQIINDYHTPERPAHHALHDAHALRLATMYALENGWQFPPPIS
jgi:hypothetical protein